MLTFQKLCLFVGGLSTVSFMLLIYQQMERGSEENLYSSFSSESEMDSWSDTVENRCEGKIHKSPVPLELQQRQVDRKKLVSKLCNDYSNMSVSSKWSAFDDIPYAKFSHLLVDDRHGIIYCYIPKVGCTIWKKILSVLSETFKVNGVPVRNTEDIADWQTYLPGPTHLNTYPKDVFKQKLRDYKKFLFVRDPFVRLISAYKDKFGRKNDAFYKWFAVPILKTFGNVSNPPASAKEAHDLGVIPPFHDFLLYVISEGKKRGDYNEHWKPMTDLCHPCMIDYDFIGRMETVDEDAVHLLRLLKVDNIINWKPKSNITELDDLKTWFSNIPTELRRQMYEIYKSDFKLFMYDYHETFDDPHPENII